MKKKRMFQIPERKIWRYIEFPGPEMLFVFVKESRELTCDGISNISVSIPLPVSEYPTIQVFINEIIV